MGVTPLQIATGGFEFYLDKVRVKGGVVRRFSDSPDGIDVVLAVDVSGPAYHQFSRMQSAVKGFVRRLRPGKDKIALLTFGADSKTSEFRSGEEYSAFTDDIAALEAALDTPPTKERTASTVLFKALTDAIELAGAGRKSGPRAVERVVVVLSDGHDEGVGYDINSPIAAAKKYQVPVFALGLPEPSTGSRYHDVLERISRESGAVFVPIKDPARLTDVYEKLDTLLKDQYVVSLPVPAEMRDSRNHVLQVVTSHQGVTLSARVDATTGVQAAVQPPRPQQPPKMTDTKGINDVRQDSRPWWKLHWLGLTIWGLVGVGALVAGWRWTTLWVQNRRNRREEDEAEVV